MNIIQCYLGKKLPKYAVLNAKSIISDFPDVPYLLVIDSFQSLIKSRVYRIPYFYVNSNNFKDFSNILEVDKKFRNGFWINTSARFLAINSAAKFVSGPFVHIESDVILGTDFPFNAFNNFNADVAFPLESYSKGCASVLFFKNSDVSQKFCEELLDHVRKQPKTTDMHFLGSLSSSSSLSISILPSKEGDDFSSFQGFFDSTSWGQYFAGIDPRNNSGYIKYQSTHPEHTSKVFGYDFHYNQGCFEVSKDSSNFPLFAMHVHSKNKKLICSETRKVEFQRLSQLQLGPNLSEFAPGVFFEIFINRYFKKAISLCIRILSFKRFRST
jgi:hypothetical protein